MSCKKCTFIHVLIVHSCYAKMYSFVVQKCTLLQGRGSLLKKGVNNVNVIAGVSLIRSLLNECALCVQSGWHIAYRIIPACCVSVNCT